MMKRVVIIIINVILMKFLFILNEKVTTYFHTVYTIWNFEHFMISLNDSSLSQMFFNNLLWEKLSMGMFRISILCISEYTCICLYVCTECDGMYVFCQYITSVWSTHSCDGVRQGTMLCSPTLKLRMSGSESYMRLRKLRCAMVYATWKRPSDLLKRFAS